MKAITWTITDHLCRYCGGRVLQSASGAGMTPGGNPIYRCADCGKKSSAMLPDVICWCGLKHRGQEEAPYRCLPFSVLKDRPYLREAFASCGCDPERGEVGIVTEADLYRILPKYDFYLTESPRRS